MAAVVSVRAICRSALRASQKSSSATAFRTTARLKVPCQAFRQHQAQRLYATQQDQQTPPPERPKTEPSRASNPGGLPSSLIIALGLVGIGAGAYLAYSQGFFGGDGEAVKSAVGTKPSFADYQKVYDAIAKRLQDEDDYDDGSYGPVLVRLAWHASGTYDKETGTGGSNGATMRFQPESDHGANSGLLAARDFLQPIREQFPWISYSDLWTLASVAAIQEMQGPIIPWRPGRADRDVSFCTPDGRLPDGAKGQDHVRAIFNRMGFNDQEIVALAGAHALGRCHTDRSGFSGPWTFSPTVLTNDYFRLLIEEKWQWKKWNGPAQYEDVKTKTLMMLPADMALVKDKEFKKTVNVYAKDNDKFFADFSVVIVKLLELGVPFGAGQEERFRFKPSE